MKVFFFLFLIFFLATFFSSFADLAAILKPAHRMCVCVCLYSRRKSSESRTDRCCCLPQSADVKATAPYVHTQDQIDTDGRANF